jgi:SAM-dependent methyltransferase
MPGVESVATSHEHPHDDRGHGQSGHGHGAAHLDHDWHDEEFVNGWLERSKGPNPARQRQFAAVRAFVTKSPDQEFRYLNLGAGPGNLDVVLLEHFKGANAVVLDTSLTMLNAARKELARFGDRVEYVQADLVSSDWTGAVGGPFDVIVSSRTIHHITDPERVRALYREIHGLTGHGGTFLNLDYVRPAKPELARLGEWITRDPEAGFSGAPHDVANMAGNLQDHLTWLVEAGFGTVEVYMKQMDLVLLGAINGHLHMPWGHGDDPAKAQGQGHGHGEGHGHAHG